MLDHTQRDEDLLSVNPFVPMPAILDTDIQELIGGIYSFTTQGVQHCVRAVLSWTGLTASICFYI